MTHAHPTPPRNSPIWLRLRKRLLAPVLVVAILASAAWRENRSHPLDFWSHADGYGDYVTICLAHALNIDFWLAKSPVFNNRGLSDNNTLHPGLPLQATSWAAYRLASMGKADDAVTRCESVMENPSAFWLSIRLVAITIGLVGAFLYARAASAWGFFYSLAVGLVYFCYIPAWDYSIRLLGNETFALPLSLAVGWLAGQSLGSSEGRSALKWWAGWGAVCALCWLNKLNYIAWTVAAVPASVAYVAIRRPTTGDLVRRVAAFGCGFFAAAYGLTTAMLGSGGLWHVLKLHIGVLTHTGAYGNGPQGTVSLPGIQHALQSLMAFWPFLSLAIAICGLSVWVILSKFRNGTSASSNSAFLVYVLCAAGLFFAATLKHYGPHYLIAGVPAVSLMMFGIGGHIGPKMRLALTLLVGLVLIHSYRRYAAIEGANYRRVTEMKAGLRAMDELPGRPQEGVLWTYRLPDRRFGMGLVDLFAGVPEVAGILDRKFPSPDLVYFYWFPTVRVGAESIPFEKAKWRYAVFDQGNYHYFLGPALDPQGITRTFFEQHCKRIIDGPQIYVLERTKE